MPLEPDRRYDGVVIDAGLTQAETGTPALWFRIKTGDGTIDNQIWITPNTVVRARKTMKECFGTTDAQLADMAWLDNMSETLHGSEVSITTIEEERQNGDREVKVQWMNPRGFAKKAATPATKSRVAQLFGAPSPGPLPGRSSAPPGDYAPPPPLDDEIPF